MNDPYDAFVHATVVARVAVLQRAEPAGPGTSPSLVVSPLEVFKAPNSLPATLGVVLSDPDGLCVEGSSCTLFLETVSDEYTEYLRGLGITSVWGARKLLAPESALHEIAEGVSTGLVSNLVYSELPESREAAARWLAAAPMQINLDWLRHLVEVSSSNPETIAIAATIEVAPIQDVDKLELLAALEESASTVQAAASIVLAQHSVLGFSAIADGLADSGLKRLGALATLPSLPLEEQQETESLLQPIVEQPSDPFLVETLAFSLAAAGSWPGAQQLLLRLAETLDAIGAPAPSAALAQSCGRSPSSQCGVLLTKLAESAPDLHDRAIVWEALGNLARHPMGADWAASAVDLPVDASPVVRSRQAEALGYFPSSTTRNSRLLELALDGNDPSATKASFALLMDCSAASSLPAIVANSESLVARDLVRRVTKAWAGAGGRTCP
ncbi:MAG: hypothetical protein AB1730_23035 [Myxococcota bacterium]